jgi:hypothetical protein
MIGWLFSRSSRSSASAVRSGAAEVRQAEDAKLSKEEITSRLASKLSTVGRKLAGTGSPLGHNGRGEVQSDGDQGLVIDAKTEKVRLPRWSS